MTTTPSHLHPVEEYKALIDKYNNIRNDFITHMSASCQVSLLSVVVLMVMIMITITTTKKFILTNFFLLFAFLKIKLNLFYFL